MYGNERRLSAIFDGITQKKKADEIYAELRAATKADAYKKGRTNEQVFEDRVYAYFKWLINRVEDGTQIDDQEGIDKFIHFNNDSRLGNLKGQRVPIQVKSSDAEVRKFKQEGKYLALGKKIIVINTSRYVSKRKFKKHFMDEVNRVSDLFDSHS